MDFVTGLPVLTNWKGETYDSIFVIVNKLTKIVHYKPVKVTINTTGLAEVFFEGVVSTIASRTQLSVIETQFLP